MFDRKSGKITRLFGGGERGVFHLYNRREGLKRF